MFRSRRFARTNLSTTRTVLLVQGSEPAQFARRVVWSEWGVRVCLHVCFWSILTGAVAVGRRLRDGAGQRTVAALAGMFVEFLLLITKLNLLWRHQQREQRQRSTESLSAAASKKNSSASSHVEIFMSTRSSLLSPLLLLISPPPPATSRTLKSPHHPLGQLQGCVAARGILLGHVCSLAACLTVSEPLVGCEIPEAQKQKANLRSYSLLLQHPAFIVIWTLVREGMNVHTH